MNYVLVKKINSRFIRSSYVEIFNNNIWECNDNIHVYDMDMNKLNSYIFSTYCAHKVIKYEGFLYIININGIFKLDNCGKMVSWAEFKNAIYINIQNGHFYINYSNSVYVIDKNLCVTNVILTNKYVHRIASGVDTYLMIDRKIYKLNKKTNNLENLNINADQDIIIYNNYLYLVDDFILYKMIDGISVELINFHYFNLYMRVYQEYLYLVTSVCVYIIDKNDNIINKIGHFTYSLSSKITFENEKIFVINNDKICVYSEYFPQMEQDLPKRQKEKIKEWKFMKKSIIHKDIHLLFVRELLK